MEPEFKHCSNCRWHMLDMELDPCSECDPKTNFLWERKEEEQINKEEE